MLAFGKALPRIRDGRRGRAAQARPGTAQGAGDRGAAARDDPDPGRQRRVRQGQQDLRPDHHARPALQGGGRAATLPLPRQIGQAPRGHPAQPAPGPAGPPRCRSCAGRSCSSIWTRTAGRTPIDSGRGQRLPARDRRRRFHRQGLPHLVRPRCWPPGRSSEFESFDSQAAAKRNVTQAIERVASRLGNTPAICRKSYVHPEIVGAYLDGSLIEHLKAEIEEELRAELSGLEPEEVAVLVFLQQRLGREEPRTLAGDRNLTLARSVPWPTPDQGADHGQPGNHAAPGAGAPARPRGGDAALAPSFSRVSPAPAGSKARWR